MCEVDHVHERSIDVSSDPATLRAGTRSTDGTRENTGGTCATPHFASTYHVDDVFVDGSSSGVAAGVTASKGTFDAIESPACGDRVYHDDFVAASGYVLGPTGSVYGVLEAGRAQWTNPDSCAYYVYKEDSFETAEVHEVDCPFA